MSAHLQQLAPCPPSSRSSVLHEHLPRSPPALLPAHLVRGRLAHHVGRCKGAPAQKGGPAQGGRRKAARVVYACRPPGGAPHLRDWGGGTCQQGPPGARGQVLAWQDPQVEATPTTTITPVQCRTHLGGRRFPFLHRWTCALPSASVRLSLQCTPAPRPCPLLSNIRYPGTTPPAATWCRACWPMAAGPRGWTAGPAPQTTGPCAAGTDRPTPTGACDGWRVAWGVWRAGGLVGRVGVGEEGTGAR